MNRKNFLQTISLGALGTAIMPNILWSKDISHPFPKKSLRKITILHTNDQHSRIESFEETNSRYPNQGGFARRATLIHQIRKQEKNVLLLDAGDIFQGTPYFNFYGGELELKLMSIMGYDAATMGNHDFDNGLKGFLNVLPNAKFPFLCTNYNFRNTILDGHTQPYKIFKKNGINIGVFGLGVELKGLVGKKQYQETEYLNPIEIAQQYAHFLRKEKKCNLVICLSHLGYDYKDNPNKISDKVLAKSTDEIDLIIGGHTHTFLDAPQEFENKSGKKVLINQVGWAGLQLGRIDFFFDTEENIQTISWNTHTINDLIV